MRALRCIPLAAYSSISLTEPIMDLQQSIRLQREKLTQRIAPPMAVIAQRLAPLLAGERAALEAVLVANLPTLFHCKHLYVLDAVADCNPGHPR